MKTTRKRYTGELKAKVALEAIRGDLTLALMAVIDASFWIISGMVAARWPDTFSGSAMQPGVDGYGA